MKNIKKLLLPSLLLCAMFGFCLFGCSKLVQTNFGDSKNSQIVGPTQNADGNGENGQADDEDDVNVGGQEDGEAGGLNDANEGSQSVDGDDNGEGETPNTQGTNNSGNEQNSVDDNYVVVCTIDSIETYFEDESELFLGEFGANCEIKLLSDLSVSNFVVSAAVEIDLNGFALDVEGDILVQNGALCVLNTGSKDGMLFANQIELNEGDLTITGGAVDCEIVINEGFLVVSGGLFCADKLEIANEHLATNSEICYDPVVIQGKTFYRVIDLVD